MAMSKTAVHPKKTLSNLMASEDKSDWQYVEIPADDPLGKPHADIFLNHFHFKAGTKHFVPPEIATELKERMKIYAKETLRILMPNQDKLARRMIRDYTDEETIG
jgi:hypothetical protein